MGAISASLVKELREKSGAGMLDCKKALEKADGDLDKAVEVLREEGLAKADKKAGRVAAEGMVASYIHGNGRIGVLIEVNCETDFAAKNEDFQQFVKDISMHIAASNPQYIRKDEIPEHVVEKEKEVLKQQAMNEGKPENIVEKMVEGRLDKHLKEICLEEQPFVKDPDTSVSELVKEKTAKIGEKISIRRFARYELGEGIEKAEENFAEEVMAQTKK